MPGAGQISSEDDLFHIFEHFDFRSSGTATQQVSKRLQTELMTLMMSSDKVIFIVKLPSYLLFWGISAFPDGDNLLSWIGTVEGPKESVYEGLTYKLRLEFPAG